MNKIINLSYLLTALLITISCDSNKKVNSTSHVISDDSLLTKVQYQTFQYFWDGAEPNSGLARERIHLDSIYPSNDKNSKN